MARAFWFLGGPTWLGGRFDEFERSEFERLLEGAGKVLFLWLGNPTSTNIPPIIEDKELLEASMDVTVKRKLLVDNINLKALEYEMCL